MTFDAMVTALHEAEDELDAYEVRAIHRAIVQHMIVAPIVSKAFASSRTRDVLVQLLPDITALTRDEPHVVFDFGWSEAALHSVLRPRAQHENRAMRQRPPPTTTDVRKPWQRRPR